MRYDGDAMRKLLNTLYVVTPDSYLRRDGENVVVTVRDEERARVPIHTLEGIVCFGFPGASPGLMRLCADHDVGISFVTLSGRFIARVQGPVRGNVLLRRTQYRMADDEEVALELARSFVTGKLVNCMSVLRRGIRDHEETVDCAALLAADAWLRGALAEVEACTDPGALRGIEGTCAMRYFGAFDDLILQQKETFYLRERNRRPPLDPMNAVLSFLYTLLAHDVQTGLETVGLDPYVGFLHTDRPGRPSLALDMMEELRPYLADRLALNLVNLRQIGPRDFEFKENGSVLLTQKGRKEVLGEWQKRKKESIIHPFLREKMAVGLLPYVQALLMARFIRGDLDGYPPYFMN